MIVHRRAKIHKRTPTGTHLRGVGDAPPRYGNIVQLNGTKLTLLKSCFNNFKIELLLYFRAKIKKNIFLTQMNKTNLAHQGFR